VYTFTKKERLCSLKAIELLYGQGVAKTVYPLRVMIRKTTEPTDFPVRVLISVPKKRVKKAVHRNRIKRLMREAWRLQKQELYLLLTSKNAYCDVMLIWVGQEEPSLDALIKVMPKVFNSIMVEINKD
jgi:ribonuclease P protein component